MFELVIFKQLRANKVNEKSFGIFQIIYCSHECYYQLYWDIFYKMINKQMNGNNLI